MTEPIFKFKDWSIHKTIVDTLSFSIYGTHAHCECPGDYSWLINDADPVCFGCTEPVPDEIQALMYLHEWNK